MREIRIGLIGLGTIGSGVYLNLKRHAALLSDRLGVRLEIARTCDIDPVRRRRLNIPPSRWTSDWRQIIQDPSIDIVIELIGGTTLARSVVAETLKAGKIPVTANKALLAKHGEELFALADRKGCPIFFEASVAGGIPLIKALREGLVGNRIRSIHGIVNGTCNYILSRMSDEGGDFSAVLAEAQKLGYAEADPALDVDGWDSAHKIAILASLAHGFWVQPDQFHVEGIRDITAEDIAFARELGYAVKLLGIVKEAPGGAVDVRVHPALVPRGHVLAGISGVFNAVSIRGDVVGDTLFYGRGAGQDPTSSAVIADLADAALVLAGGVKRRMGFSSRGKGRLWSMDKVVTPYYLRLSVLDQPGVLARIAAILGGCKISIASVIQRDRRKEGRTVPLILLLHESQESSLQRALRKIDRLACVRAKTRLIRIETFK